MYVYEIWNNISYYVYAYQLHLCYPLYKVPPIVCQESTAKRRFPPRRQIEYQCIITVNHGPYYVTNIPAMIIPFSPDTTISPLSPIGSRANRALPVHIQDISSWLSGREHNSTLSSPDGSEGREHISFPIWMFLKACRTGHKVMAPYSIPVSVPPLPHLDV